MSNSLKIDISSIRRRLSLIFQNTNFTYEFTEIEEDGNILFTLFIRNENTGGHSKTTSRYLSSDKDAFIEQCLIKDIELDAVESAISSIGNQSASKLFISLFNKLEEQKEEIRTIVGSLKGEADASKILSKYDILLSEPKFYWDSLKQSNL